MFHQPMGFGPGGFVGKAQKTSRQRDTAASCLGPHGGALRLSKGILMKIRTRTTGSELVADCQR